MRKWTFVAVVAVAAAATVTGTAAPAQSVRLQGALDAVTKGGATGAVAEVVRSGSVWRGTSGTVRAGETQRISPRSRFRIGSVTKSFVATVVLQLASEGRLRLSDPASKYLPRLVPDRAITVRDLLDHRSGIDDFLKTLPLDPPSAFLPLRWKTWTARELAQRGLRLPRLSPPGRAFHYSSTNYILLGMLIQRVTGHSYADEIERRIVRPLHLSSTELPGTDVRIRGPHAHGYVPVEDGRLVDVTLMNPSVEGASGEIISSANDLDAFFKGLLGGALLPRRELAQMTRAKSTGFPGRRYGLGLVRRDLDCGVTVYGHEGDSLGYSTLSFVTRDLERRATISLTWGASEPDAEVDAFLARSLCP